MLSIVGSNGGPRRAFVFAALALCLCAAGCDESAPTTAASSASASATAPAGPAKIVADAPVHEFGKVKLGTVVEHTFKVRNAGKGPLTITRAKGS